MIVLEHLTKTLPLKSGRKVVLDDISAAFPTGRSVALLGRNGAGKSTLLRIISGAMRPTSGRVLSDGLVSYPVGFQGSFHPDLTGLQNTRFVGRLYGVDTDELVAFVEDFADLGPHFRMPIRTYSHGMRSRLSFGISMGIPFDTYLVDEVTSVGDGAFRRKSAELLRARLATSGAIIVSHGKDVLRELCDFGAVLEDGRLHVYDDLEQAFAHHDRNMSLAATV